MGIRSKFYVEIKGYHEGVTGSCIKNTIVWPNGEKFCFLVDYGMYQEKEYEELSYNDEVDPSEVDALLLTHNHLDHNGAIPILVKKGYSSKIYTSLATSHLIRTSFTDSLNIFSERFSKKNKKLMPYNEYDMEKTLSLIVPVKYEQPVYLDTEKNVKVTFFNNAHLVGAALILVQIKSPSLGETINLLFTGDFNIRNNFMDLKDLPQWLYKLNNLTIITEATYGTTNSSDIVEEWEDHITWACRNNLDIYLPAIAQGRYQELLYRIKLLQETEKIPRYYAIKADGKTGLSYTFSYLNDECLGIKDEMKNFLPQNLQFVTHPDTRHSIPLLSQKKIVVFTSGMGGFGPSRFYIPEMISNKNAMLHFNSYLAEGSLGRELMDTLNEEAIEIMGITLLKKAKIMNTSEFSGHAKADELIGFIKKFKPRAVLVNHGEKQTKPEFCKRVSVEANIRKVGNLGNGFTYRIDPFGILTAIQK